MAGSGKTKVEVKIDKLAAVARSIAELATTEVMVGVPDEKAGRDQGPISNAALAYIHENGAPEAGIPPRPFLKPAIMAKRKEIASGLRKAGEIALLGKPGAVMRQFERIGLLAQSAVRAKITSGPFTPLAESTLAARRRRGVTRTKPLIDTGQLRASISYVVRRRK